MLPHFEIISPPERQRPLVEVFDFSQLNAEDSDFQVDTGVTSGADSSEWDEISIDDEGRVDTCIVTLAKDRKKAPVAPPACPVQEDKKSTR